MAKPQVVKLGFLASSKLFSLGISEETIMDYLLSKSNLYGRILLNLDDYLVKYIKHSTKFIFWSLQKKIKYFLMEH